MMGRFGSGVLARTTPMLSAALGILPILFGDLDDHSGPYNGINIGC
jgi:hypothetical protein